MGTIWERRFRRLAGIGILALVLGAAGTVSAQKAPNAPAPGQAQQFLTVEEHDAQQTKSEFYRLFDHYPPTLLGVFKLDPSLLTQEQYLTPYPALANFLK